MTVAQLQGFEPWAWVRNYFCNAGRPVLELSVGASQAGGDEAGEADGNDDNDESGMEEVNTHAWHGYLARVDRKDGMAYTFDEVVAFYSVCGTEKTRCWFTQDEILKYWQGEMLVYDSARELRDLLNLTLLFRRQ